MGCRVMQADKEGFVRLRLFMDVIDGFLGQQVSDVTLNLDFCFTFVEVVLSTVALLGVIAGVPPMMPKKVS